MAQGSGALEWARQSLQSVAHSTAALAVGVKNKLEEAVHETAVTVCEVSSLSRSRFSSLFSYLCVLLGVSSFILVES